MLEMRKINDHEDMKIILQSFKDFKGLYVCQWPVEAWVSLGDRGKF